MATLAVRLFCPCSEKVPLVVKDPSDLELTVFPTTIIDHHTWHPLSFLNFCQECQAIKCRKCTEIEVVTKFCPRCMHEMKPEHSFCSRNCFDCPLCRSNIVVSSKSSEMGKSYHFKCTLCNYTYDSAVLEKPRSLARVVKNEVNELDQIQMFSDLEKFYIQSKQIQDGHIDIHKAILKQCAELKIKDSAIPDFIRRSTVKPFDLDADQEAAKVRSRLNSNSDTIKYDNALIHPVPTFAKSGKVYPVSTKLRVKHSKRCKACRTSLMKPDHDPTSVKFYKLSNSIDFLPTITIHPHPTHQTPQCSGSTITYVLTFQNPLDSEVQITLSSPKAPPQTTFSTAQLPITNFKLGARPENSTKLETIVKSTPSIQLNRETKLGRVELMSRVPANYEIQEGIYERAMNFCVIPINIMVSNDLKAGDGLRVPVLVGVRGKDIACGYWIVLDMGTVE